MPSLSIVILARNEARNIVDCVRSARFADEIVVLDSGSTDGTPELARAEGARVCATADWPGFGVQKNRALALATGDWVFSLDADERITPELREQVRQAIATPGGHVAFAVSRLSSYCGRDMRHSGWYPDRIVRLFRRGTARFSDDLVHERVLVDGPVGQLRGELLHRSMPDFEAVLDKVNRYSTAGAQALAARGRRASPATALGHGLWAFVRTYVVQRGFLDGAMGLALAISNAEGTYYRYLKLWLLQRERATGTPHP
ncbi:MAG: glycosyltransferase family 2 protein [Ramlibacter sp.]